MSELLQDLQAALAGACVTEEAPCLARVRDTWPQAFWWDQEQIRKRRPVAVALPEDEAQVAAVLNWAQRQCVPIVPRGAGSGVLGAAIPDPGSVILDLTRLNTRFEIADHADGPFVKVGAGFMGHVLEQRLNDLGYSLLHFPASIEVSTVGGWVATRSFGQLSTLYGGIERQLRSLRVAYPGKEVVEEQPGLHVGAEGTLGIITEASLRIRPLPQGRSGLGLSFSAMEEALGFLRKLWSSSSQKPAVLRLYSPVDALASLGAKSGHGMQALRNRLETLALKRYRWLNTLGRWAARSWVAIVIYEDAPDALKALGALPGPKSVSSEPASHWWDRRYHWSLDRLKNLFENGCFGDTLDLWGSWDVLPFLDRGVREAIAPHAFVMSHLSHFDDKGACLYVTFAGAGSSPEHGAERHRKAWRAGLDACARLGGRPNHHHGVGLAKLPWLLGCVDREWYTRLSAAKHDSDPKGLLNPGKLCL